MKIAIISPFPPFRGGISKETETIYNSLKKEHEVKIINFKRSSFDSILKHFCSLFFCRLVLS